jgi:hypothetical protein
MKEETGRRATLAIYEDKLEKTEQNLVKAEQELLKEKQRIYALAKKLKERGTHCKNYRTNRFIQNRDQ